MLLNAANLHVGGGVQVATSIIGEISRFAALPDELVIWVSTEVDANLKSLNYDLSSLRNYEVVDLHGFGMIYSSQMKRLSKAGRVLTIFGPLYSLNKNSVNIVGFAQPWIIYPDNDLTSSMSLLKKIKFRLKYRIQSFFFNRADKLLVELDHVKKGLLKHHISDYNSIDVIPNCISSIYLEEDKWQSLPSAIKSNKLKLGFVGRNYPHKNTAIFPAIVKALKLNHNIDAEFYVTFSSSEWEACSHEFRQSAVNVGILSVAQCPNFYRSMDAVVFPSLLECFSATPLEAMVMRKPLFSSNFAFNRDVSKDFANYFNPSDSDEVADKIATYFLNESSQPDAQCKLDNARLYAINFSNAKSRAESFLSHLISGS